MLPERRLTVPISRAHYAERRQPKLLISLFPCKLEFQVADHDLDLRTSIGFESVRIDRCSVLFEEKG
jgi:hypothetical protein